MADDEAASFALVMNWKGALPLTYPGLHLSDRKISKHSWLPLGKDPLKAGIMDRKTAILGWKTHIGELGTLLPSYYMSIFKQPK